MSKLSITFLGTGPAVAIPRLRHQDAICRDAHKRASYTRRMRSSLLVTYKKTSILIDAGPDFLKQVKNIKSDLAAVFLTHEHLDAVGGLHDLNSLLKTREAKVPLYCLKQTWKKIADPFSNLKINYAKSGKKIRVDDLAVTPFHVRHGIKHNVPTLGFHVSITRKDTGVSFRVRHPERTFVFVYASDMDGAPSASRKFFRNAPLVIIDSAMWFGRKFNGHFNPEQAIKFLLPLRPQKVLFTQIGHSWPPHNEAVKKLEYYCKKQKLSFPVLAAHDEMRVIL